MSDPEDYVREKEWLDVVYGLEAEVERLQARERELGAAARPLLDHLWTTDVALPTGETIRLLRALGDVLDAASAKTEEA